MLIHNIIWAQLFELKFWLGERHYFHLNTVRRIFKLFAAIYFGICAHSYREPARLILLAGGKSSTRIPPRRFVMLAAHPETIFEINGRSVLDKIVKHTSFYIFGKTKRSNITNRNYYEKVVSNRARVTREGPAMASGAL